MGSAPRPSALKRGVETLNSEGAGRVRACRNGMMDDGPAVRMAAHMWPCRGACGHACVMHAAMHTCAHAEGHACSCTRARAILACVSMLHACVPGVRLHSLRSQCVSRHRLPSTPRQPQTPGEEAARAAVGRRQPAASTARTRSVQMAAHASHRACAEPGAIWWSGSVHACVCGVRGLVTGPKAHVARLATAAPAPCLARYPGCRSSCPSAGCASGAAPAARAGPGCGRRPHGHTRSHTHVQTPRLAGMGQQAARTVSAVLVATPIASILCMSFWHFEHLCVARRLVAGVWLGGCAQGRQKKIWRAGLWPVCWGVGGEKG